MVLETAVRKELKRGVLIAIEGIDGAGKTTQTQILMENLKRRRYTVVALHEPTDGKWGKMIEDLAQNGRHTKPEDEFQLFYLDRMEDVKCNIAPALRAKSIVVMDRYYFSNVAYQSARGMDSSYIERKNQRIAPSPDVSIILNLEPDVALRRIKQKRNEKPNHFERRKYLEKVKTVFLNRFSSRPDVKVVDGDDRRTITEIASDIWNLVEPIVRRAEEDSTRQ